MKKNQLYITAQGTRQHTEISIHCAQQFNDVKI